MPQPTGRDLYLDQPLSDILVGYKNPTLIAGEIGNPLRVMKDTGFVPKLLQSQFFRNAALARRPGTKATESGFGTDLTDLYYLSMFSHAVRVHDSDRQNAAGGPFELDRIATMLANAVIDLKREVTLAAAFFAVSKGWVDETAGSEFVAWDDAASSNPALDIDNAKDVAEGKIGAEPRLLIVGKQAYTKGLKWNPALIDVFRFTQKGILTEAMVGEVLDVDLKVGRGIYTTSVEGVAESSVSYTRIWGKKALLLNQPATNTMSAPSIVRITDASKGEKWVRRIRYEEEMFDKFEANTKFQFKQIDARGGTFFENAVS